ncbi:hypothetical protein [Allomesorhizobium alhagi]|jgi:hypothetical protein|uniref:Uncharacterized protein n=1 Tax=Mesorhizobium alhagi CCNWXJ12-2 TaxID=1107882 RepID=H0HPD5_9HYPH|nr:hypothetical protein [Mesorhizobium alhagi]EHK57407.1 hypothetical protein MAXJ12_10073 [Mesorhizobium alhagi CCNWXJ12-2]
MTEDLWFGVAVIVLLAAMAAAFARWGRGPGEGGGSPVGRFVLIATAVGGLIGAPFWWLDLAPSFAWDLPPLASRMLGVAALAFGVTGVAVLEHPSAARERLFYILILAYLVPLALAAVFLHLDRFDFARPVTYGFFAVVIVLCVGSALELSRGRRVDAAQPSPGAAVRGWLLLAGLVLAVWGAALFLVPTAPYPQLFNWPQDELSSRLIAAMLVTVAVAFFLSRRDAGLARLALLFAGVYGIGVVAAGLMNAVGGKPMPLLYVTGFGVIGLVSLGLLAGMKGMRISPQAAS